MKKVFLATVLTALTSFASVKTSEITVDLKLDNSDFIVGERVRGVVNIANSSPDKISYGYSNSKDRFFIEVFRANDMMQLTKVTDGPVVATFVIESGEGQKLETFLGDHFVLQETGRYLARPVLAHSGMRYEGQLRAFDIIAGIHVTNALQMFANERGLQREFELVYWMRKHSEHIFLKSRDAGNSVKRWETHDLGPILRIDAPSISVLQSGEIIVLHRLNQDQFVRSEFWSLPDALEFRKREAVQDPEVAGTARVRELYKEGGVKPKSNPWWKFW